jgi:hypothetical protein
MPIITKNPVSAVKGQKQEWTLVKADLGAIISDSYWQNPANWKLVMVTMKSTTGSQVKKLQFDCSEANPKASFIASLTARDNFQVQNILIEDQDEDLYEILRNEIPTAQFDVALSAGAVAGSALLWSVNVNDYVLGAEGAITRNIDNNGGSWNWGIFAQDPTTVMASDFELSYEFNKEEVLNGMFIGIGDSTSTPADVVNPLGLLLDPSDSLFKLFFAGNTQGTVTVPSGFNTFKVKRVGTVVSLMINGTTVATHNTSASVIGVARLGGKILTAKKI